MPDNIAAIITTVQSALQLPYANAVSAPVEATAFDSFSNFLRNTPSRKVFLINHSGGDHEYDEDMTPDKEIDMEIANDRLFAEILNACEDVFGPSPGEFPANMQQVIETDYDNNDKEGTEADGIPWTPEYEGGAIFRNGDSFETCYWTAGNDWIFLQKGKWTGDGNFIFYILVTITPMHLA